MNRSLLMFLGLTLLTAAVYWPVHHYGFIDLDDFGYVNGNPHVQTGFSITELKYAFTTYTLGNWNPLLWISFYTDRWMFGIRPGAMHIENLSLHLITGLLLWRVLALSTGKLHRSFIVAAIFLLHPMHVESVVWISERKDTLSTPLLIGAMLAYVCYCKWSTDKTLDGASRANISYVLMTFLFVLSLMAKSMGVTLPAILLLLDFWPLQRWPALSWIRLVVEKIPLLAIALVFVWLAQHSQEQIGATSSLYAIGLVDRIDNAIVCYTIYIAKLLVPTGLCIFYQHPGSRPLTAVIPAAGLLAIITAFCVIQRRKKPYLLMGWCWFSGTLLPVIGLVQVGAQAMADRYSYLPSIGLSIAAVWGLGDTIKNPAPRRILAITVLAIFSCITIRQVHFWKDDQTLFTHAVDVTDDNPMAHDVLAQIAYARNDIHGAIDQCNLALRYRDNARAYAGLGNCWMRSAQESDHLKAVNYYRKAVALDSHSLEYRLAFAAALRSTDQLDQARQQALAASNIEADNPLVTQELAAIKAAEKSPPNKKPPEPNPGHSL